MASQLLFARYAPRNLEPKNSIGAKWLRMLDAMELESVVSGKRTVIKMHLGGDLGFTTIHPFFARKLVEKVKAAGAKEVFVSDIAGSVKCAADRGYTSEVLGCPLAAVAGLSDRYIHKTPVEPPFMTLSEVELAGEIVDAEALIDFSHVKAHGDMGFGGACKNLAMGCITQHTRFQVHGLEGGLEWDADKCSHCNVCVENCPNGVISFNDNDEFTVFYHNCKFCQHCVLICPEKAVTMVGGLYKDLQKGMAIITKMVLDTFSPENIYYINVLTYITIFCDCWGMTSPTLVPDIGILAGKDVVAIDQASLDLVKIEDLIPGSLPPGWELGEGKHLFEKIHRKDPYVVIEYLQEAGLGSKEYEFKEIE